jgi:hypothetical protein
LKNSSRCLGQTVEDNQHKKCDRSVAEKGGEGGRKCAFPTPLGDAGEKICLQGAGLKSGGESEPASKKEIFEHYFSLAG